VVNLSLADAREALANAGFTGGVDTDQVDSLVPEGTVTAVTPARGTAVAPDTRVTLAVSDGDAPIPSVTGDQAAATQTLRTAGFTDITPQQEESSQPAGTVLGTTPAAGQQATAAAPIVLRVSSGPAQPQTVAVPDVVDQDESSATATLRAQGFVVAVDDTDASDPGDVGIVVSQSPSADAQVAAGSTVTITVGRTPSGGTATATP
jgi:serine/threonine-protein kinase